MVRAGRLGQLLLPLLLLATVVRGGERPVAPEQLPGVVRLSAEETAELILSRHDLVVIDTRLPEEYAKGHVETAINIVDSDLTRPLLAQHLANISVPVLFYCGGVHCLRSTNACRNARSWGYEKIYWFRGGWGEWLEKGLPVTY